VRSMKRISLLTVFAFLLLTIAVSANEGAILDPNLPESWMHAPRTASEWGITSFNEAPMLAERVKAGELPPVEERLPVDPPVIEPYGEIGVYGGTAETWGTELDWWGEGWLFNHFGLWARALPDGTGNVPELVKGWEYAEDNMSMIVYMREGLRWSDGAPYTADDVMFFWEYVEGNTELTPTPYIGRDVANIEKIDDYTLKITFHQPTPHFHGAFSYTTNWWATRYPAHYMKQFHVDFRDKDELLAEAKEYGYDTWFDYFNHRLNEEFPETARPTLRPYVVKERTTTYMIAERNPYFPFVDTAGNQLPYIDRVIVNKASSNEMAATKAATGEATMAGILLRSLASDIPLFSRNQAAGDYNLRLWNLLDDNSYAVFVNLAHEDPVLRELFMDVRTRIALSLAIDRDEINDKLFFGMAEPRPVTLARSSHYYPDDLEYKYIECDPERAKAILDELGVVDRNGDGWRELPNGSPLKLKFTHCSRVSGPELPELLISYWRDIGIDIDMEVISWELWQERKEAGEFDLTAWDVGSSTDLRFPGAGVKMYAPVYADIYTPFTQWGSWVTTNGEAGVEPPQEVLALLDLVNILRASPDEEARLEAGRELVRIAMDNVWSIGTVGFRPCPIIVSNRLKNVPQIAQWADSLSYTLPYYPSQFYLVQD